MGSKRRRRRGFLPDFHFPRWAVWAAALVGLVGSIGLGYEWIDAKYARLSFVGFQVAGIQQQIDKLALHNLYSRLDRLQRERYDLEGVKRPTPRDRRRLEEVKERIRRLEREIQSVLEGEGKK